jgi:uncharacterized protein (TIGR03085 family)
MTDAPVLAEVRHHERAALLADFETLGPEAPTLCGRWRAADLAAHLVVSEAWRGWPLVAVYRLRRVLPPAATRRGLRAMQAVGEREIRRARAKGWERLLERLHAGPPRAYRRPPVAEIRLVEEWIHHEDLRRASGMVPRPGSPELDDALWSAGMRLTTFSEFLAGRDGVEVATPDGRRFRFGAETRVRVEGRPGELLLFLAGRGDAAEVEVSGDRTALVALQLTI